MSLIAKEEGEGAPLLAEDSYHAVCYSIYDIGHQFSELYGKAAHQCIIIWEIPEVRIEWEREGVKLEGPRSMSNFYTLSLHEKARLRKDLESWRGKAFTEEELGGFDIHKLIGANCMLQVIHKSKNNKTRAVIASVTKLPKGLAVKQPENKTVVYSLEDGQWPEATPEWIVKKIKESEEYKESVSNKPEETSYSTDTADDSVPF